MADAGVTFKPLTPQSGEPPPQPMVEPNIMDSGIAKSSLPANMFVGLLLGCHFSKIVSAWRAALLHRGHGYELLGVPGVPGITVSGVRGLPGITVSGMPFTPGMTVSGVPGEPGIIVSGVPGDPGS